ncbi:MAG: alpha/beta hydrolase [Actinomycetota bacterium]|nr:alpha/beta hydrolase [Actinomycetota bacterium]
MHEPARIEVPSVDGVVLAVHDYGGSGKPVLFVHGTGMCSRMWEPILDRLPADRLRFLTVDLRGHGLTITPSGTAFQDHRMIADLTAVIDHFDIVDGFAVGHSMGGGAAILSGIERPRAFQRVWAYEPILMAPGTLRADSDFLDGIRRRRSLFPDLQAVYDRYSSRYPLDELHPDCLWAYLRYGFREVAEGFELLCLPSNEALAFEQFEQGGFGRLADVPMPALVASGGAEPDYPPALSAPMVASALSGAEHELWPDSKHFGPFSLLDQAARSILRWFTAEDGPQLRGGAPR